MHPSQADNKDLTDKWLETQRAVNSERDCNVCKYAGCDPDGPYCAHPKSFEQTMFGRGFNMMRNATLHTSTAVCGPDGKLFEPKEAS